MKMKKSEFFSPGSVVLFLMLLLTANQIHAQQEKSDSEFGVNVDLYSSYVWRGTKLGRGPSVQPTVKFSSNGFTVGVWGAVDASGWAESDPFVSYTFPFGLSVGVTDYYYPGLELFDVSKATGSQAVELNGGFTKGGLSLSANYILNEAGGVASAGGDKYFQAGFTFSGFNIFVGAGDGWHTSDGKFNVCNVGIGAGKEIKLSGSFSIPVNGQVIVNPEREQLYILVGFSF